MDVGYNESESVEDLFKEIWERECQAELNFEVNGAGTVGCSCFIIIFPEIVLNG